MYVGFTYHFGRQAKKDPEKNLQHENGL